MHTLSGPHLEVKLLGEDGQVVPIGERGDICTRGYAVMQGYWDDPERTAETVDGEGWLHSGDLGVMDEDGYVSKLRNTKRGQSGGTPFYRGALYTILKNPIDIGKVKHHKNVYSGRHEAIVDEKLWNQVHLSDICMDVSHHNYLLLWI